MSVDVLLVSLGATPGWKDVDAALAQGLCDAGLSVEVVTARRPREVRTFAATDLVWALAARRATREGIARLAPRAVLYSTVTAALLAPVRGAIRFDEPPNGNRPGRHGLWQRPLGRRRLRAAPLRLALSDGGADAAQDWIGGERPLVVPAPIAASAPASEEVAAGRTPFASRDLTAITYAANPEKKGLDRVLAAWARARRDTSEELVVAGLHSTLRDEWLARGGLAGTAAEARARHGVRFIDLLPYGDYRALLRRTRLHLTAPRHEDHGITQLEALADGCMLVTTAAPGPYPALEIARALDSRLVGDDIAAAIRCALDAPADRYAERAAGLLAPLGPEAVAATLRDHVVPALGRLMRSE